LAEKRRARVLKALIKEEKELTPDECVSDHHHSEEMHESADLSIDHCNENVAENPSQSDPKKNVDAAFYSFEQQGSIS
jgi:hypothetical protein